MKTTTDTYSGKPFRWNDTIYVRDNPTDKPLRVPARITTRNMTYLHPSRVPDALLRELNNGRGYDGERITHDALI